MRAQCRALKRDGTRCTLPVQGQRPTCWAHDPANAEQRRRVAAKGGRSKASKEIRDLKNQLSHESNQEGACKKDAAALDMDRSKASNCGSREPYKEPGSLVPKCDQSDISDQSPDYRAVVKVLEAPPYWLRHSYMSGYQKGTITVHVLSAAVAAALGRSPYEWTERLTPLVEQALKKEVTR